MAQLETNNSEKIKVLSVVWYKVLPAKFGGQKAVALFNQHLGRYAQVICLCSKNNSAEHSSYKIDASLPVNKMQFFNPFVWMKIYRVTKGASCSHLILEFPYHGLAGIICKKLLNVRLIINCHNIEYRRFKEQKKWWWGLLYHYEKWALQNSDTVFFKTEKDRNTGIKRFRLPKQKTTVVPYGAVEVHYNYRREAKAIIHRRHHIGESEKLLLFAGTLDYQPNAEAAHSIVEKLIPSLNQLSFKYKIIICGRNYLKQFRYLQQLSSEQLVMAGEVADVGPYFLAADVFINPVMKGGGIQTKTLDALSYHLNVVCFEGKQGVIKNAGNKIFPAKDGDWNSFAVAVIKASEISEPTDKIFFTSYSWDAIAHDAYQKLAAL
jgi:hypothetical protein